MLLHNKEIQNSRDRNRAYCVRQEAVVHGALSAQGRKQIPLGSVALIESPRLGNLQQKEADFWFRGLDW